MKCVKNHSPRSPTSSACNRAFIEASWCITLSLCPREARKLQSCCEGIPELVGCREKQCPKEDKRLDMCMQQFTRDE